MKASSISIAFEVTGSRPVNKTALNYAFFPKFLTLYTVTFFRTLFFFVVFWLHQLVILPFLITYKLRTRKGLTEQVRLKASGVALAWGRMVCWLGGVKDTLEDHSGLERGEAVMFVSNHQGDFDIPLLLKSCNRPMAFVAKKELEHFPLLSGWMGLSGCIFLDRANRRRQVGQIKEIVANLQSGLSMVIFPEGTRSRSPEMAPFAKGSLNIAERAGVRIVPVTLKDTYTLKPKGSWGLQGGKVKVILHPAIDPKSMDKESKGHLHEHVQAVVQSGLDA